MTSKTSTGAPLPKVASITTRFALKSGADLIVSGSPETQERFLQDLSDDELLALPFLFDFWALDHQIPPEGDWRTWVILGGRGAGKTRAGSEWIRSEVEGAKPAMPGRSRRVALIGETLDQVRDVMIFGDSGIMACAPPDRRPVWQPTKKRLVWPNGAQAQVYSAHEPEALRGPQFDAAWVDELAKWKKGAPVWDMLQFCLRLGDAPRQCVTTTPRNVDVLKRVLGASSTVVTRATTFDNRAHLSASFLEEAVQRYGQTRLGQQELEGRLLEDIEGALWTHAIIDRNRIAELPALHRIVVAVDPPVTGGKSADTCGIVVAGATSEGLTVVLEDCSVQGLGPSGWAKAAISAYERYEADRLVAEVNQGGDLVESVIRQIDRTVSYRAVHATRGKSVRAEPVAALYEQGRVKHLTRMHELEAQMTQMTVHGFDGSGSPDRVDALVWAVTDLILRRKGAPKVRGI